MTRVLLALGTVFLTSLVGCAGPDIPFHPTTPVAMAAKPGEIAWVSQGKRIYACTSDSSGVRCVPATIQAEAR